MDGADSPTSSNSSSVEILLEGSPVVGEYYALSSPSSSTDSAESEEDVTVLVDPEDVLLTSDDDDDREVAKVTGGVKCSGSVVLPLASSSPLLSPGSSTWASVRSSGGDGANISTPRAGSSKASASNSGGGGANKTSTPRAGSSRSSAGGLSGGGALATLDDDEEEFFATPMAKGNSTAVEEDPPVVDLSSDDEDSFVTAASSLPSVKKGGSSAAPSKGKAPVKRKPRAPSSAMPKKTVLAAQMQVVCGAGDDKVTGLLDVQLLLAAAADKRKGDVIKVGEELFSLSAFEAMGGLGHQRHPRQNIKVVVGSKEGGGDETVNLASFIKNFNLEFPTAGQGAGKGKRAKKE